MGRGGEPVLLVLESKLGLPEALLLEVRTHRLLDLLVVHLQPKTLESEWGKVGERSSSSRVLLSVIALSFRPLKRVRCSPHGGDATLVLPRSKGRMRAMHVMQKQRVSTLTLYQDGSRIRCYPMDHPTRICLRRLRTVKLECLKSTDLGPVSRT